MFVKIGDFTKFKGFSCGIPREQAILRKSKTPRKSPDKWTFLSLAFYNAPSLHTVDRRRFGRKKICRNVPQQTSTWNSLMFFGWSSRTVQDLRWPIRFARDARFLRNAWLLSGKKSLSRRVSLAKRPDSCLQIAGLLSAGLPCFATSLCLAACSVALYLLGACQENRQGLGVL